MGNTNLTHYKAGQEASLSPAWVSPEREPVSKWSDYNGAQREGQKFNPQDNQTKYQNRNGQKTLQDSTTESKDGRVTGAQVMETFQQRDDQWMDHKTTAPAVCPCSGQWPGQKIRTHHQPKTLITMALPNL